MPVLRAGKECIDMSNANKYAGTQTEKNLMAAFAGESEARNKYTYFASKAKKDGYEQIAALFLKTAENEAHRHHLRGHEFAAVLLRCVLYGHHCGQFTRRRHGDPK